MSVQRWADAAFEQERLLGTIRHNPIFRSYMEDFQHHAYEDDMFPDGMMLGLHESLLQMADPMYVSPEVTDMWEYAAESFKPEVLHAWDLPCPVSFAFMPRPVIFKDAEGNRIAFRALSWIPAGSGDVEWREGVAPEGVWYTMWSHIDDLDDFNRPDMEAPERESWEALGTWSVLFSGYLPFGVLEDYQAMTNGNPDKEAEFDLRRRTWLMLQSFWRMSRQIVPTKAQLPRQLRRDRKRHYRTEDVTVITLRRQRQPHDDHDPSEVDWKWQWVVRGHWRNQYYKSLGAVGDPAAYRQIWIMPFMKGPEDAPIKPVKRAFEFTR
jgi:hypothetical protein